MSKLVIALFTSLLGFSNDVSADTSRPNIIWIVVEDSSPHMGCYGEETISTPHLDQMAKQGVRFDRAFVTSPVCSPSRSAMVTGVYQTTLGAHNHRSQGVAGKSCGTPAFFDSYLLPVKSIPRLFQEADYFTCNSKNGLPDSKFAKTDYNFIWDKTDYDGADWGARKENQPFFAQIQLKGGKNRKSKHGTDPSKVNLPPYYPDHPVLRDDWATYLNSWVQTDIEVGAILQRLEDEGIADSTVLFFWTDHGVSHARGKQFLYEEGIHVPLIVLNPQNENSGEVRTDLVTQIDIAASSLALAGIDLPKHIQGVDLFANDYHPRDMIFSARDRCDETVEIQRCVRTTRYKYIRNFLPHLPHLQWNEYKDNKAIIQTLRSLHSKEKLNELQSRMFTAPRSREELYDLDNDPHEMVNLAGDPSHGEIVENLRTALYDWMVGSKDVGLIPEPILEELGHQYGSKYFVLQQTENQTLIRDILEIFDTMDFSDLRKALKDKRPSIRYWAATALGLQKDKSCMRELAMLKKDPSSGIRVAAALALCRLGDDSCAAILATEIENENQLTGMYALRALEMIGPASLPHMEAIRAAQEHKHEFSRRIARRLSKHLTKKTDLCTPSQ